MGKVFTITEGLVNLGALKSGGQGSVYKARRSGDIITAIKILPTPIASETEDDKNFSSFQNEVQKLKKVNESPNPNVVSIIASGITTSGNLPYIEMEYIEGPDLGELLTPPSDPVFTIKETIKVADHLSNALAHCHRADIKHGDIKSNNVKFNQRTGNYILLDFGLSIMSDEQRRTSIRHAGAIEFMAPEQNLGVMHFETDVYSLGIILFELLAGTVPFPLTGKSEVARNAVMIAHMETQVPDILLLRNKAIPSYWGQDKKDREMQVPAWLISMMRKCLEKEPSQRFRNGMEMQEFIHNGIIAEEHKMVNVSTEQLTVARTHELQLKKQVEKLEAQSIEKNDLIDHLQTQLAAKEKAIEEYQYAAAGTLARPKANGVSKGLFFLVLFIALGAAGFTAYNSLLTPRPQTHLADTTAVVAPVNKPVDTQATLVTKPFKKIKPKLKKSIVFNTATASATTHQNPVQRQEKEVDKTVAAAKEYKVISKAFFHASPDEHTRGNVYIIPGDETITAMEEQKDFVYVAITDAKGKTIKGWVMKKNLQPVNDY